MNLYIDGSCKGNPGPGGWAYVIVDSTLPVDRQILEIMSGSEPYTTNNRMELTALIKGLESLIKIDTIYTDSMYIVYGCRWLEQNKDYSSRPNADLWSKVSWRKGIQVKHIRAHSGNKYNEFVDKLASFEANKIVQPLG